MRISLYLSSYDSYTVDFAGVYLLKYLGYVSSSITTKILFTGTNIGFKGCISQYDKC